MNSGLVLKYNQVSSLSVSLAANVLLHFGLSHISIYQLFITSPVMAGPVYEMSGTTPLTIGYICDIGRTILLEL